MGMLSRLQRFARSPQGKKLVRQAQDYAKSPEGKRRIAQARQLAAKRGGGSGRRPTG